jgi:hypothetical protein
VYGSIPTASAKSRLKGEALVLGREGLPDVDHHALAVDVCNLQSGGFGAAQTCGIQQEQNRSVAEVGRGFDQLGDFLRTENHGELLRPFGHTQVCASSGANVETGLSVGTP